MAQAKPAVSTASRLRQAMVHRGHGQPQSPAVKRTMSLLCYGRAPAVRQPVWYPVRASTE